jgi:hypothetical protein
VAALATRADVEARLGRTLTEDEQARITALLSDSSELIRAHTGQIFEAVTGDVIVLRPVGVMIRLPQRPVTAVTTVAAVGRDGSTLGALSDWSWDGRDKVNISCATPSGSWPPGWDGPLPDTYQVTYSHGYATIPPIVVATAANMVLRTLLSPSMATGMVSERIGAYNYQLQQSSGSSGAVVSLTSADERALARYGPRRSGTIQVEAG